MNKTSATWFLAAASISILATQAPADTVLIGEETPLPGGQPREAKILVAPGGVRMGALGAGHDVASKDDYMIFRADRQLVWFVQPTKRQYMQMDKQMMSAVGQQISSAMGMLQAQMAAMPPEQRAQVEGMLKGLGANLGGDQAKAQPLVQKVASGEKIGSWTCDRYASRAPDGKLLQETWVAPADSASLPPEDGAALRAMGTFFEDLGKSIQDAMSGMMPGLSLPGGDVFRGLPVRFVSYDAAGQPDSQWELKSIRKESIPGDAFEVPQGFSQQNLAPPSMGPGIQGGFLPGGRRDR